MSARVVGVSMSDWIVLAGKHWLQPRQVTRRDVPPWSALVARLPYAGVAHLTPGGFQVFTDVDIRQFMGAVRTVLASVGELQPAEFLVDVPAVYVEKPGEDFGGVMQAKDAPFRGSEMVPVSNGSSIWTHDRQSYTAPALAGLSVGWLMDDRGYLYGVDPTGKDESGLVMALVPAEAADPFAECFT